MLQVSIASKIPCVFKKKYLNFFNALLILTRRSTLALCSPVCGGLLSALPMYINQGTTCQSRINTCFTLASYSSHKLTATTAEVLLIFTLQILISYNITYMNIDIETYETIPTIKSLQDLSFSASLMSFRHSTGTKPTFGGIQLLMVWPKNITIELNTLQ